MSHVERHEQERDMEMLEFTVEECVERYRKGLPLTRLQALDAKRRLGIVPTFVTVRKNVQQAAE